ncbi:EstA family serine hydrolase [Actinosynnema sp. NPDC047251]|uniref:Beta-lactamase n=1 Tax=Saccharothrix espanaensis (strain ATCC 51144 / DSM 44229 / JCM 9112 / NBRC 15066 / NRRL 15764) TaxID=1179773 RepID=K0K6N3_SACES|nr:EstA family serine hydrolase [Saccharothrix espanaensis]CCH33172.1 beta-lactamase [Saccharothrix espanaensis DSM 44229]
MSSPVEGTVAPGFERVAEVFAGDGPAQCCVYVGGEPVVDLWRSLPEDALLAVFSATKGATAACANLLVQRGLLDLDAPVTDYWPEYGQRGKESTLVRWLLSHRAGLLAPEPGLTFDDVADWDRVVGALAAAAPVWAPGTDYGYHAQSFGWLVGEVVRRVDGRGLGRFFAEEVAGPAGAEFWIGLPEPLDHRVVPPAHAPIPGGGGPAPDDLAAYVGPHLVSAMTMNGAFPDDLVAAAGDRRYRAAELGGSGGVASARGLARLYAWLLDAFTPETVADVRRVETSGPDRVLTSAAMPIEQRFGRGFMPAGPPGTFGHPGLGTTAFADPSRGVAFGHVTPRVPFGPPGSDPDVARVVDAVYARL